MKKTSVTLILFACTFLFGFGQNGKKVSASGTEMPGGMSTKVTVPKQTQGSTFGEKVKIGIADGDCIIVFPHQQAFRASSSKNTVTEMSKAEQSKVHAGLHATGGALAQGASLLGGALPGGAVVSAKLSKTGAGRPIWEVKDTGSEFTLPNGLPNGNYKLLVFLDGVSKDAAKKQIQFELSVSGGAFHVVSAR